MTYDRDLTAEQSAAIEAFAEKHGANWREKLGDGWVCAAFPGELQQIRNQFGPTWLFDHYAWGWRGVMPAWQRAVWGPNSTVLNEDRSIALWSAAFDPPALGAEIITRRGWRGHVTGYFTDHGWLGLIAHFPDAPANREPGNPPGHVFGAECRLAGGC